MHLFMIVIFVIAYPLSHSWTMTFGNIDKKMQLNLNLFSLFKYSQIYQQRLNML